MNNTELTIVADENMPAVDAMFSPFGRVIKVNGRSISNEQIKQADVLLVRSVTQVNQQLLEGSKIKFVGSATIGTDHIDVDYLTDQNIAFSNAPGCNADAVVEYDINCITQLLSQSNEQLSNKRVAIIGVGNVGQRLADRLSTLGVKQLMLNDPPRAQTETGFSSLEYCLENADIVLMHTPLVKKGAWPTKHLITAKELALLPENSILLNAGRGAVIHSLDLLHFLQQRSDIKTVLDVWEHEPLVDSTLANLVSIATPHIAGYSLEGKIRGTLMLKSAFCHFMKIADEDVIDNYLTPAGVEQVTVNEQVRAMDLMKLVYDPFIDDRALRATLNQPDQAKLFDLLRKNYPQRREFYSLNVTGDLPFVIQQHLNKLGFTCES